MSDPRHFLPATKSRCCCRHPTTLEALFRDYILKQASKDTCNLLLPETPLLLVQRQLHSAQNEFKHQRLVGNPLKHILPSTGSDSSNSIPYQSSAQSAGSRLERTSLERLPFTSNTTHYVRQDQNFERVAQGLETRGRDMGEYLSGWDTRFASASYSGARSSQP